MDNLESIENEIENIAIDLQLLEIRFEELVQLLLTLKQSNSY